MLLSLYVSLKGLSSSMDHTKQLHSLFGYFLHLKIIYFFFSNLHLFNGVVRLQLQVYVVFAVLVFDSLLIVFIDSNWVNFDPKMLLLTIVVASFLC